MSSTSRNDNRYWSDEDTDSTVSEWVNLTEGEEYYFEVNHYTNGWGSDHMAVAVEIEDSGIVGHHHTMKELQMVWLESAQVFEVTRFTVTNPDDGEYILIF
jgi:hypothetical protein